MQWIQILIEGNTHVSDLKEITVNIFGANEAEGSMEEYGMQDACSIAMFSISISKLCSIEGTQKYTIFLLLTAGPEVWEKERHPHRNVKNSSKRWCTSQL